MRTVVYYITGHGFGHASRSIEIINALLASDTDLQVAIRTSAPRWLFDLTVRGKFRFDEVETDTGIVQIDSLRLDERASVERLLDFMSTFDERVAREADALTALDASLVVADMPPLGIGAAKRAGLPAIATGNFTWDWIYSAYEGTASVWQQIAEVYAQADLALRMPMWGGFDSFKRVIDLPFVARRGDREPEDTKRALGFPLDRRLVLPSFGGHGLDALDKSAGDWRDYHVISDLDEKAMYAAGFRYEDVVRAVDAVVTKPGYGIIAECLANDTALLYTDRGHFIEYDVLVNAMPRFLRCAYINHDDLFAGRWQQHLDRLLAQPEPPERPCTDGAEVAAQYLRQALR